MRDYGWVPEKVGDHAHDDILRDVNQTSSDGHHAHTWLIEQDMTVGESTIKAPFLLMSSWDGAHYHPINQSGLLTAEGAGAHRHAVHFPGDVVVSTEEDGTHVHEVHVRRTPDDGQHTHVLKVGKATYTSLMGPALAALSAKLAEGEVITIIRCVPDATYPDDVRCSLRLADALVGKSRVKMTQGWVLDQILR